MGAVRTLPAGDVFRAKLILALPRVDVGRDGAGTRYHEKATVVWNVWNATFEDAGRGAGAAARVARRVQTRG